MGEHFYYYVRLYIFVFWNEFTILKGKKHKYEHIWKKFKLELLIFWSQQTLYYI